MLIAMEATGTAANPTTSTSAPIRDISSDGAKSQSTSRMELDRAIAEACVCAYEITIYTSGVGQDDELISEFHCCLSVLLRANRTWLVYNSKLLFFRLSMQLTGKLIARQQQFECILLSLDCTESSDYQHIKWQLAFLQEHWERERDQSWQLGKELDAEMQTNKFHWKCCCC